VVVSLQKQNEKIQDETFYLLCKAREKYEKYIFLSVMHNINNIVLNT